MKPPVYSFDVFDTCLTRTVADPADIFFLLAADMLDAAGIPRSPENVAAAANVRLRAEQAARRRMAGEDLLLDAIYAALPEVDPFGFDPGRMLRRELELEQQSLRPVPEIRARIAALRDQGRRIAFISDMYLPGAFVRERLAEHGLALPEDPVYVSGDIGKTKHTGALFRHVLADLGLEPGQLAHCGDNPRTDLTVPRSLGILAEPFTRARLTPREERLRTLAPEFAPELSALAAAGRACRLDRWESPDPSGALPLVADVVAPVLASFVRWVLARARAAGWRRLYFVSRDGQILWRMAQALPAAERDGVECRYLHGSRQAWFLPALDGFDPDQEQDWLFVPGHSAAPRDILKKLDLAPADLKEFPLPAPDAPFWSAQPGAAERERFAEVLRSPAFAALAEQRARAARENALAYLGQEGLLDGAPVVLVDIGWTLKAQKALRVLLRGAGWAGTLHGLYLGVQAAHAPNSELHAFDAYVLEQPPHLDRTQQHNAIFRNANCIEQVFSAGDHGQVQGYARTARGMAPVLAPPPGPDRLARIAFIQEAACGFAAQLADPPGHACRHEPVRQWCVRLLQDFLSAPNRAEALALQEMAVFDDQNESRSRPLARPLGLGALLALALRSPRPGTLGYARSFDWIEGSIALSPAPLRGLLRHPKIFNRLRTLRISQ